MGEGDQVREHQAGVIPTLDISVTSPFADEVIE